MLKHIRATATAGVYVLVDFHPFLAEPMHVRMLKDICLSYEQVARTVVLLSDATHLPRELEPFSARFELSVPDRDERRALVEERRARNGRSRNPGPPASRPIERALELLVENLNGLTTSDTRRLARKAIFDDGALSTVDLPAHHAGKVRAAQSQRRAELRARHGEIRRRRRPGQAQGVAAATQGGVRRQRRRPRSAEGLAAARRAGMRQESGGAGRRRRFRRCRCCGWISRPSTTNGTANRSATCATRSRPRNSWRRACCGSTRSRRASRLAAGGWRQRHLAPRARAPFSPGWPRRKPPLRRRDRQRHRGAASGADPQGTLRRDLLRRSAAGAVRREIFDIHAQRRGLQLHCGRLHAFDPWPATGFQVRRSSRPWCLRFMAHAPARRPRGARHVLSEIQATRPLSRVMAERIAALRAWADETNGSGGLRRAFRARSSRCPARAAASASRIPLAAAFRAGRAPRPSVRRRVVPAPGS